MDTLKEKMCGILYQWTISLLTTENVQKLFQMILAKMKEKADATENEVDNILVSAMEYVVNDKEKIAVITNFIKSNLDLRKVVEGQPDYYKLAEYVAFAGESKECESIPIEVIAQLMKLVVPSIIDYLILNWGS